LNEYGHSSYACPRPPYFPPNVPQFEQEIQNDANRRHPDYPQIINYRTINYRDHHYYRPAFYNGAGDSNSSDQSWMDSTTYQCSTPSKDHMAQIRMIMTPIRNLLIVHFGGDQVLIIMNFKYEFVSNV